MLICVLSAATVKPKVFDDIKFSTKSDRKGLRRTTDQYGKTVAVTSPSVDNIFALRQKLYNATQHLGQHVPATSILTANNFGKNNGGYIPTLMPSMPHVIEMDSVVLAPCADIEVSEE